MLSIKLGVLAIFLLLFATSTLEKLDAKPGDEWTSLDKTLCAIGFAGAIGSVFLATLCAIVPAEKKSDNEEALKINEDFEIDEGFETVED